MTEFQGWIVIVLLVLIVVFLGVIEYRMDDLRYKVSTLMS
jgi:hypothetical protein